MPRVFLTQAQRDEAKAKSRAKELGDALIVHKALHRLTYEAMAGSLGIDKRCLRKIMDGGDCYVPMSAALAMMDMVR